MIKTIGKCKCIRATMVEVYTDEGWQWNYVTTKFTPKQCVMKELEETYSITNDFGLTIIDPEMLESIEHNGREWFVDERVRAYSILID